MVTTFTIAFYLMVGIVLATGQKKMEKGLAITLFWPFICLIVLLHTLPKVPKGLKSVMKDALKLK